MPILQKILTIIDKVIKYFYLYNGGIAAALNWISQIFCLSA